MTRWTCDRVLEYVNYCRRKCLAACARDDGLSLSLHLAVSSLHGGQNLTKLVVHPRRISYRQWCIVQWPANCFCQRARAVRGAMQRTRTQVPLLALALLQSVRLIIWRYVHCRCKSLETFQTVNDDAACCDDAKLWRRKASGLLSWTELLKTFSSWRYMRSKYEGFAVNWRQWNIALTVNNAVSRSLDKKITTKVRSANRRKLGLSSRISSRWNRNYLTLLSYVPVERCKQLQFYILRSYNSFKLSGFNQKLLYNGR